MSEKRRADLERRAEVRLALHRRDGYCLLAGRRVLGLDRCFGGNTPHHLDKRGPYELDNLVILCAAHNVAVEDHPDEAHALGLVVRWGETLDDAAERRRMGGLAR